MLPRKTLRRQLIRDLARLQELILKYASGNSSVKRELERLEGAVEMKLSRWRAREP